MGIADELLKEIMAEFELMGTKPGSIDEFNKVAAIVNQRHNERPNPDFEGLSSIQMQIILSNPFTEKCLVRINPYLAAGQLSGSPMVQMALKLLRIIRDENGLKLTSKGNLPRKVVQEINELGYFKEYLFDLNAPKVVNEEDYLPLSLCHILLKISGYVKVAKGKLTLTKKGLKGMKGPVQLFCDLFLSFCINFSKGFYDGYPYDETGQFGVVYILYLLSKYGDKKREASFYGEKYFKAFPMLLDQIQPHLREKAFDQMNDCFTLRVFVRGFFLFGLIELESVKTGTFRKKYNLTNSKLFGNLFLVR